MRCRCQPLRLRKKYGLSDDQLRPYTFNMAPYLADRNVVQQGFISATALENSQANLAAAEANHRAATAALESRLSQARILASLGQLAQAYRRLDDDAELRVGVLYAVGGHFTAGLDLPAFAPLMQRGESPVLAGDIDPTDTGKPGTGLGLAIARDIAHAKIKEMLDLYNLRDGQLTQLRIASTKMRERLEKEGLKYV